MPIAYRIDHERKLVLARAYGTFASSDPFEYQREVWSRPDVAGYDELVDMTDVTAIEETTPERVHALAAVSAQMDRISAPARFAIVAPGDLAYGLGRMFQTHRNAEHGGSKEVGVYRTMDEALAFLKVEGRLEFPPLPSLI
jgi:hypothetical protein